MVQLALLAASWTLMRRYVSRRRTRLDRENIVRRMTNKLRAMAKCSQAAASKPERKKSTLAALSA